MSSSYLPICAFSYLLAYSVLRVLFLKEICKKEAKAVIGVFHDINLALQFADKLIFLKDGIIQASGKKDEVLNREILQSVYGMDVAEWMKDSFNLWLRVF